MSNTRQQSPLIFHRSMPMTCPYLDGRVEQQLFAELSGANAQQVFETLGESGFRRSHHIIYRPACPGCNACIPVRIPVAKFKSTKAWRRILKANADIRAQDVGTTVTQEQYNLFQSYVTERHGEGDMAKMTARDYVNLVTASPVDTRLVEFRDAEEELIAACLIDCVRDGFSAVYSYFRPELGSRSLGSYMILWLIEEAARRNLDYVYLGFWIENSPKMAYKARFQPLEAFGQDGWYPLDSLA